MYYNRTPPTTIDVDALLKRNPKHEHCNLVIKVSPKNPNFIGLYCREHNHWFMWLNSEQIRSLVEVGIETDCLHLSY